MSKDRCNEKPELLWYNSMNKKTELDVADFWLLGFYHSQSSNDSFYHDHSKKNFIVSCILKPLIIL